MSQLIDGVLYVNLKEEQEESDRMHAKIEQGIKELNSLGYAYLALCVPIIGSVALAMYWVSINL